MSAIFECLIKIKVSKSFVSESSGLKSYFCEPVDPFTKAEAQQRQPTDSFSVFWPENKLTITLTHIKMNYVFALIRAHIQVLEPAAAFNYDLAQTADLNLRWREICAPHQARPGTHQGLIPTWKTCCFKTGKALPHTNKLIIQTFMSPLQKADAVSQVRGGSIKFRCGGATCMKIRLSARREMTGTAPRTPSTVTGAEEKEKCICWVSEDTQQSSLTETFYPLAQLLQQKSNFSLKLWHGGGWRSAGWQLRELQPAAERLQEWRRLRWKLKPSGITLANTLDHHSLQTRRDLSRQNPKQCDTLVAKYPPDMWLIGFWTQIRGLLWVRPAKPFCYSGK